jgi:crotonobetainyl-CoA:carnitine CoA-transferase CaiB-like acyl-CoA transferase
MKPFNQLLVVELAGSVAGSHAGKMFADLGARVVKIEPSAGDPRRAEGEPLDGMGTVFAALNTGKESVALDVHTATGATSLHQLLARADLVIESSAPEPLHPVTADTNHPHLVRLFISPFGLSGPYAGFRSTAFTDYAISGHMYLNGESDREPIQGAGRQPEYAAGTYGFIGAMVALQAREQTGRGQTVDVSHHEAMSSLHQWTTVRYTHGGFIQRRIGNRYDTTHPITIYPCKDGHVAISPSAEAQGQRFLAVTGLGHLLEDPRFATGVARLNNADAFDELLMPWLMEHTVAEIVEICQTARIPAGPVPSMMELLEDEHLNARGFWRQVAGSSLRYPGPAFRMSGHEWSLRPPPRLGDSAESVLSTMGTTQQASAATEPKPINGDGPLAGVRVLDLSRVWAGPLATRILGDFGADVIRVEAVGGHGPRQVPDAVVQRSRRYPGNQAGERPWNREGMYNKFNRNKRAITLQLNTPQGKAIFERLVQQADIVIENYSPRVMPQLGLGYERLRELNPGIIYIGMPGYGWSGPCRDWVAYGTTLEPGAGLSSLMGYPDSGPYKSGVAWADPVAGLNAASALLVALWDRCAHPEGRGQAIELAQLEGMITFTGEEILAAQAHGYDGKRLGNRHPVHAPQGCYPCAGEDRWIAITITDDAAWLALCEETGFGASHAALGREQRMALDDTLDAKIAAWTATREQMELMHRLQARGVAACAVLDAKGMVEDPHLAARGFFVTITHPDAGIYPFPGQPVHLSETPATFRRPAPGLGQHNREVLGGLLDMTDAELEELHAAGVIAEQPPA